MVNVIKDIVNKLDGYSVDNQGFMLISSTSKKLGNEVALNLEVKAYLKDEGKEGIPETEYLSEIVDRLMAKHSDSGHYAVYSADYSFTDKVWSLTVQEISL